MEDTKELEAILRSLLISSATVLKANRLERDFEEQECKGFPYRKLGFCSFVEYLQSIPNVVSLSPRNGVNPDVLPISSAASKHVDDLIRKQRIPTKRGSRGRSRKVTRPQVRRTSLPPRLNNNCAPPTSFTYSKPTSSYNSQRFHDSGPKYTEPPKTRQPSNYYPNHSVNTKQTDPTLLKELVWDLDKEVSKHPNGVNFTYLEQHLQRLLQRSRIKFDDVLRQAIQLDLVEQSGCMIYPHQASARSKSTNGYRQESVCDDEYDEDEYDYYDDDDWDQLSEEEISNNTIKHFSSYLPTNSQTEGRTIVKEEEDSKPHDVPNDRLEDDYDNSYDQSIFSKRMIENFRHILKKHPDGILASMLLKAYLEEFKAELCPNDLGFNSTITMVSALPKVFTVRRYYGDWKLFDARSQTQTLHEDSRPTELNSDIRYIPKTILDNIKALAENYTDGFKTSELQSLYKSHYHVELDLEALGFQSLDRFLSVLKNTVTIRRSFDCDLIYPKHHTKSLADLELEKPVEVVTVPRISYLGMLPEFVVTDPNFIIPFQELPPLQEEGGLSDPLLEIEVRIGEIYNPGYFYFLLSAQYNKLQVMMDDIDKLYKRDGDEYKIPRQLIVPNLYVACMYNDYFWHRAKVLKVEDDNVEVEYIDYGSPGTLKKSDLRLLHLDFTELPIQAILGKLMMLEPPHREKKWPKKSSGMFLELVGEKRLFCQLFSIERKNNKVVHSMILYDTNNPRKEIIINQKLVDEGLAAVEEEGLEPTTSRTPDEQVFNSHSPSPEGLEPTTSSTPDEQLFSFQSPSPILVEDPPVDVKEPVLVVEQPPPRLQRLPPPPGFKEIPEVIKVKSSHDSIDLESSNPTTSLNRHFENNVSKMRFFDYPTNILKSNTQPNPQLPSPITQTNLINQNIQPVNFLNQNQAQFNLFVNSHQIPCNVANFSQPAVAPPTVQMLPNYPTLVIPPTHNYLPPQNMYQYASANFPPVPNHMYPPNQNSFPYPYSHIMYPPNQTNFPAANTWNNCQSNQTNFIPTLNQNMFQFHKAKNMFSAQNKQTSQSSPKNLPSASPQDSPSVSQGAEQQTTKITEVNEIRENNNVQMKNVQKCAEERNTSSATHHPDSPNQQNSSLESCKEETTVSAKHVEKSEPISESREDTDQSEEKVVCKESPERPEPALSPASREVDNIFKKKSQRKSVSSLIKNLNKELTSTEHIEEEDELIVNSESVSRLSDRVSSLSSTSDEYASCSEAVRSPLHVPVPAAPAPASPTPAPAPTSLCPTVTSRTPVSWEDITDENHQLIENDSATEKTSVDPEINKELKTRPEKRLKKTEIANTFIRKLVIDGIEFHLVKVKDDVAVLADEFFPLVTRKPSRLITKLLEAEGKEYPVISKLEHPHVFLELEKVEFHPKVDTKVTSKLTRRGRANVTFVQDIPEIFSVLSFSNSKLLDKIKEASRQF